MEEDAKKKFKKLDQMLEYRQGELNNPAKSDYVKGLIKFEIEVLEFLADQAKTNLVAQGINV